MGTLLLIYVVAERLLELVISRRNSRRLLARGAIEVGAGHYPAMVALHVSWLASIITWASIVSSEANTFFAVAYILLQVFRFWIMASLGEFWCTRIITLPGAPLVRTGPYKFLRHPNYVLVTLEVAVLPLVYGAWQIALIFSTLNAAMLWVRIGSENAALSARR